MRHRVRSYLALALTCLLVFTGQAMAVARGMPLPVDQIVICSGSGPVMIHVDADGQPTGSAHLCPENALGLIQALAVDAPVLSVSGTWFTLAWDLGVTSSAPEYRTAPHARDPPTLP